MAVIKGQQIDGFVAKPDPRYCAALIYGPDRGTVSERTRKLITSIAGTTDDPFAIARMDDAELGEDPGRLEDEARAIPMLGGPRVVWIQSAGNNLAKALKAYLDDPAVGSWVVAEAGALAPSSKLRQLFEKSKTAAALPCYADTNRSLDSLIEDIVSEHGLTIAPDASHRLASILGADRSLSRSEIEKLCLYCHGTGRITVDDVDAACGDVSALAMDDLIDHTFEGDLAGMDTDYRRLLSAGTAIQAVIASLFSHIARLRTVQAGMAERAAFDNAIGALRPPLHFSRKGSFKRQIGLWSLEDLKRASAATAEAEYRSRGGDGMAEVILGRHLLTLAHAARLKGSRTG